jgi:hypothetical protein
MVSYNPAMQTAGVGFKTLFGRTLPAKDLSKKARAVSQLIGLIVATFSVARLLQVPALCPTLLLEVVR